MKTIIILGLLALAFVGYSQLSTIKDIFGNKSEKAVAPKGALEGISFYTLKANSLIGSEEITMEKYKGKTVVILNTASKCGFTPQYADWEAFHKKHGENIVVLGFPADNFMHQEPGSNDEIAEFCTKNYGVSFQMFDKVSVKGNDQHPLYKWLSTKELNGWNDKVPTWNFCKYIIDKDGKLTHFFGSKIKPTDEDFIKAVGL